MVSGSCLCWQEGLTSYLFVCVVSCMHLHRHTDHRLILEPVGASMFGKLEITCVYLYTVYIAV